MKTTFKLEGAADLERALGEFGEEVATKLGRAAVRAGARKLQARAVTAAPLGPGRAKTAKAKGGGVRSYDYGHLRDNLRVRREETRRPGMERYIVSVGRAFWGSFLEFGTRRMAPRPWFRPAFDGADDEMLGAIVETLSLGVERAARRAARKAKG